MYIDHIFICSQYGGREATELVDFGLTEGSSRTHPGQGTINRKFYFEQFFLEILWVNDESEIRSESTAATGLWERFDADQQQVPFGLCLGHTAYTDEVFLDSSTYQPAYFPEGMTIDFISEPSMPWLFRLPFKGPQKGGNESTTHACQIRKLTKAIFKVPDKTDLMVLIEKRAEQQLFFEKSSDNRLTLEYDHCRQQRVHHFRELPLTIKF